MAKIIGITGGIATGKSAVSNYLKNKGFIVVDTDKIIHHLQEKGGELYKILTKEFGDKILNPKTGEIDRRIIGNIAFSSPENLSFIEDIQRKVIHIAVLRELVEYANHEDILFLDCPLLYKEGFNFLCEDIWTVICSKEKQIKRLMERNNLNAVEVQKRLNAQSNMNFGSKTIIENNNSKLELFKKIDNLLAKI